VGEGRGACGCSCGCSCVAGGGNNLVRLSKNRIPLVEGGSGMCDCEIGGG